MESIIIKEYEIKNRTDLDSLSKEWKEIEKSKDMTVFQSFDWNVLLFEEEKKRFFSSLYTKIIVITIHKDNLVYGIAPLIIQKYSNKTKWFGREKGIYILGHGSWSDYLNLIYSDNFTNELFKEVVEYLKLKYKGYTLFITDLREDTRLASWLKSSNARISKKEVAVQVVKMNSPEEYEKSLSKHVRQNLRTAKNRMEKAGIRYELKVLGKIDDNSLINQLTEIHIARMAKKNMITTDIIHRVSSYIRIKYREKRERNNNIVSESMKTMNESCLVIVYLDGDIAGYLYGLRDDSVIRIMQNCVKDEYKFYSPLFRGAYDFILEQYSDDSIRVVDFTRGDEQYKYNLGGVEVNLESWNIDL